MRRPEREKHIDELQIAGDKLLVELCIRCLHQARDQQLVEHLHVSDGGVLEDIDEPVFLLSLLLFLYRAIFAHAREHIRDAGDDSKVFFLQS